MTAWFYNATVHANTVTTTKVYAPVIKTADEIASDTLEDVFASKKLKAN